MDKIHVCTIASMFPYISITDIHVLIIDVDVSISVLIIDIDVSITDVHVLIIDVDVLILDSYDSISSIDMDVGSCDTYTFAIAITSVYVANFVGGAGATNRVPRIVHARARDWGVWRARLGCVMSCACILPQTSKDGNIDDSISI